MADDAGFAAALTVRQRVLSDALLFAYCRESFSRALKIPVLGGPPVSIDSFLAPPQVSCDGARNVLVLNVEFVGGLTITESDGSHTRGVDGRLEITVRPKFTLSEGKLALSPTPADVRVTRWTFDVVFGGAYPPNVDAYLRSDVFRDRLTETIRFGVAHPEILPMPSVDISLVGSEIVAAAEATAPDGMTAQVPGRVVDGALMVGLNVNGFETSRGDFVTAIGNPAALSDFARDYDVAVATNPVSAYIQLQSVEQKVVEAVGSDGTLNDLEMIPADGQFDVSGSASNSDGTATFSFAIVPHFVGYRPGVLFQYTKKDYFAKARQWPAIWFSTDDVHVDVEADLSFWEGVGLAIGTVLSVGVLLVWVEETEDSVAYGYGMEIRGQTSGAPIARVRRVTSAALDNVTLRIAVDDFEITTDGTYMGVTITPEPLPVALIGPQSIPADLRSSLLTYQVRLPVGVVPEDPTLRIQWTIIDPQSGTVYVNDDQAARNRETFTFVPDQAHAGLSTYAVGCRVYRKVGSQSTDIFNDGIDLAVGPPLLPQAYVHWDYDVQRPELQFDWDSDSWRYLGDPLAHRHSKLHRTHNGCTNAAKPSRYFYRIEHLDSLPFPVSEIDAHRAELCDYCFYGGPAGLRASL
jgi:hypothetical protein